MNCDTRHLIRDCAMSAEEMKERGYEPVPEELRENAELELMGKNETYVGGNSSGKLSTYMRNKKKARMKACRRVAGCRV